LAFTFDVAFSVAKKAMEFVLDVTVFAYASTIVNEIETAVDVVTEVVGEAETVIWEGDAGITLIALEQETAEFPYVSRAQR